MCFPDFLIAQKQQYFLSTPHINMVIYFESNCDRVISENIYQGRIFVWGFFEVDAKIGVRVQLELLCTDAS